MSYTELHTGKLTPVKTIKSHQEFMDFVYENELTGRHEISIEMYLDTNLITDVTVTTGQLPILLCTHNDIDGLPHYCFYENVIYRFDDYIAGNDKSYINRFIKNSNGSIDFVSMFNSWLIGFEEELQDGLDALLDKGNKDEDR